MRSERSSRQGRRTRRAGTLLFSTIARVFRFALVFSLFAAPVRAQERRAVVVGTIGGAGLGHADSEQGNAPIFGSAVGFHLTACLVVEGDVDPPTSATMFGRDHHDFTETTFTGNLLFRSTPHGTPTSSPVVAQTCSGRTPMSTIRSFGSTEPKRSDSTRRIWRRVGHLESNGDQDEGVRGSAEDSTGSWGRGQGLGYRF